MPLARGVLSPSVLGAAAAPETEPFAEAKKSGDCVEVAWSRALRGVACEARCEACEASFIIWSLGPSGGGLEGICELLAVRALLRGVAEAELRVVRR
jgi:hypothetical protein